MVQKHFGQELDQLKNSLTQMTSLVTSQITMAAEALEKGDLELCRVVKSRDKEIDAYENLIQAQCENLFALFQPVATDLRYIMSAMMVNNQLERCGDIAVNIVQRAQKTADHRQLIVKSQILDMLRAAQSMTLDAISAFLHNDVDLARKVIAQDDVVDNFNKQIFNDLVERMKKDPQVVEPGAHLIVLTRQIERMADHSTNIAEDVVFLVEAQIVAHRELSAGSEKPSATS
ncbi:MAG: phosphate signaling complex protein PhoU [Calditrichaeota bacterium]|nr:MAG: phosphate signaling complex protein PhoU [Calditrichota bacterium]